MDKPLVTARRNGAVRTVLLLAGLLVAVSACAAVPRQPLAAQTEVPSSSQAADSPQTGAWTMQ